MMVVMTDLPWAMAQHECLQRPHRAVHVRTLYLHSFFASSFTVTLPFLRMSKLFNCDGRNILELFYREMKLFMPLPDFTMMQSIFTWSPDSKGGLKKVGQLKKKKGS